MKKVIIGKVGGEDWIGTNDGGIGRLLFKLQESEEIYDKNESMTEEVERLRSERDELYEALECICSYLSEDGLITAGLAKEIVNAQRVLDNSRTEAEQDDA